MTGVTKVVAIVDDRTESKCRNVIEVLRQNAIEFEVFKSITSVLREVYNYPEKYCGMVLDMQLPQYDNEPLSTKRNGGEIILKRLSNRGGNIPILLNTTSYVPEEKLSLEYYRNVHGIIRGGYETKEELNKIYSFVELVREQM